MKLEPIAEKYNSDKCGWHSYGPIYDRLFEGKTVRKVLEIGIGYETRSVFMWAEYFPEAEIYGLDIRTEALVNEGRIHSIQCDQSKLSSMLVARQWAGTDFDLIVDDGSHFPEHQLLSACVFRTILAPGGRYVIEDVGYPEQVARFLPFDNDIVDLKVDKIFDDRMIVSQYYTGELKIKLYSDRL
jgi:SAM-dependent methyltransferase